MFDGPRQSQSQKPIQSSAWLGRMTRDPAGLRGQRNLVEGRLSCESEKRERKFEANHR